MDYNSFVAHQGSGSLQDAEEDKKLLMQVMTEEIEDLSDETYTANCVIAQEVDTIKQEDQILTQLKQLLKENEHGTTRYLGHHHARFGRIPTQVR